MPTKTQIQNIKKLSEKEKIELAKQALDEYLIIMAHLTEEARKIFIEAVKNDDQKKIKEIMEDINKL